MRRLQANLPRSADAPEDVEATAAAEAEDLALDAAISEALPAEATFFDDDDEEELEILRDIRDDERPPPKAAPLLWEPLDAGGDLDDWRSLAPDGASAALIEAYGAAHALKAATRDAGTPAARQASLQAMATLKRLAETLDANEVASCADVPRLLAELRQSSDRIVATAARGTKAKWASVAGPSAAGPASPAQDKTVARAPASPERETSSAREIEASEAAAPPPEAASSPPPADDDRAAKLERRVKALEADLAASKQALGDERAAGEATAKKLRRAFNDAKKAWAAEAARLKSDADKAKASADAAVARAKKALDADRAALERKAEVARGANFCANCRRSLLPAPPKPGAKPKYVPKGGDRRPPPRR